MRVFVLAMISLQAYGSIALGQERIDLPRAIELALKQNRTLAVSALQAKASVLGVDAAEDPFGLKISPNNSAALNTGHAEGGVGMVASKQLKWGTDIIFSTGLDKTTSPSESNDVTMYQGTVGVELRQPLLRGLGEGVNTEGIASARSNVAQARRLVEMMKVDMAVETVDTYLALLRLRRQKQSASESASRMERVFKVTKAMERRGGTTHIDTLRSELQLGQALARVESCGQEFDSRMWDFAELLGADTDKTFDLAQVPFVDEELPEMEEVEDIALQHRLDYAQSLQDLKDSERGELVAKNRVLPDLALTLKYQRSGEGEKVSEATDLGDSLWFVGLSSRTDIFRKDQRIAYQQALVNGEVVARNVAIMERSIRKQSKQYLLAYKRGLGELRIARRNYDLAKARAALSRKMFEIGKADNFSVTDAEESYLSSENQLLQSETETTLAGYQLRRALGTLLESPSDLLPPQETRRKESPEK